MLSDRNRIELRLVETGERQEIRRTLERLYTTEQMSTTEIAREIGKSQSFVWSLSRRLGIRMRSPNEAKAIAAPARIKTLRRPFSGPDTEAWYLKGFAEGDLDVRKPSSTAVMVSSTTTHPAFSSCFTKLFQEYGPVYHYPIFDRIGGYRWKVASRLDNSFSFMLPELRRDYPIVRRQPDHFFAWLAGIVDTDGGINIVRSGSYVRVAVLFSNQDVDLLSHIKRELAAAGYYPTGPYLQANRGHITPGWSIRYNRDMWSLYLQRGDEVQDVLRKLPLRHEEKQARKELVLEMPSVARWDAMGKQVLTLRASIEAQVKTYVSEAETEYKKRGLGQAT